MFVSLCMGESPQQLCVVLTAHTVVLTAHTKEVFLTSRQHHPKELKSKAPDRTTLETSVDPFYPKSGQLIIIYRVVLE